MKPTDEKLKKGMFEMSKKAIKQQNHADYRVLAAGDYALLDGNERGKIIHISDINAMIVLDDYDYSDNEAYPYHNVNPNRLTACS